MTLSGGQQQRVAIARAIYTHPTILLGDELTGNLDSTTSISVMKFLKKMCKKYSQTMIIVTHDERIAAMADQDYSDERWEGCIGWRITIVISRLKECLWMLPGKRIKTEIVYCLS